MESNTKRLVIRVRTPEWIHTPSGHLRVTDPCYPPDMWCAGTLEVKGGSYQPFYEITKTKLFGRRVSAMGVYHVDSKLEDAPNDVYAEDSGIIVGVDSGTCSIIDLDYFQKINVEKETWKDWYNNDVRFLTSSGWSGGTNMGAAFVACSGTGDGSYECRVHRDEKGAIDGILIVFIP